MQQWERAVETVGEAELLEAVGAGQMLDCGGGRRVDAQLLRRCCHDLKGRVDPRGIRLAGATITGEVDLAGLEIPFPLHFSGCEFDSPLTVEGAALQELTVTGCKLPGLLGNGVRVRLDLNLSGSRVVGAHETTVGYYRRASVWLCEADIGGHLLCAGTLLNGFGERALQADRMRVGGTVRLLQDFTAIGQVRLLGAHVEGSVDFAGARLSDPGGVALDLSDAAVGGNVLFTSAGTRRLTVKGRLDMNNARVSGRCLLRRAVLTAPPGRPETDGYSRHRLGRLALSAQRLTVGGEIAIEDGSIIHGGIDLSMSSASSLLIDPDCSLDSPRHTALDLSSAEVLSGVVIAERVPVAGTIRLAQATVHGRLALRALRLSEPDGESLIDAVGATIDGDVDLSGTQADGGDLSFRSAVIGGAVDARRCTLNNPDGNTLDLVQAAVKGSVRLADGFVSRGRVTLNRALIEGRLLCTDGTFDDSVFDRRTGTLRSRKGSAISAISATVNGGMDLGWRLAGPSIDFTNARTSYLADDPARWPGEFTISGFRYERLGYPQGLSGLRVWDHAARREWLGRQAAYDAGPYEHAARVFRQHGYARGAQEILIAQRRHARSTITGWSAPARRLFDIGYSLTVGYGYRPARVLWGIVLLIALVTVSLQIPAARATMRATDQAGNLYTTAGPVAASGAAPAASRPGRDACSNGQVRCFNPVLYAVDTVIPLVALEERATWYPDTATRAGVALQWWLNAATVLGWLLSSIFVLALANLARSD